MTKRTELSETEHELIPVLKQLVKIGAIENVTLYERGVYFATPTANWRVVAQYASMMIGGTWDVFPHGVFNNRKSKGGWIVDKGIKDRVETAREVCKTLTGIECGFSVGSAARNILKWAVKPEPFNRAANITLKDAGVGYHQCYPGKYKDCWQLDIRGAYFQYTSRLETLRFHALPDGTFLPQPLTRNEKAKLFDALSTMSLNKPLRNAVWGCMIGSRHPKKFYHGGYEKWRGPYPGKYQSAGNLVARIGWELNLAACVETNAVYAQTDCIICPNGVTPLSWAEKNIEFRCLDKGATHIQHQHSYKCGTSATEWYDPDSQHEELTPVSPLPRRMYCNEMLLDSMPFTVNWNDAS